MSNATTEMRDEKRFQSDHNTQKNTVCGFEMAKIPNEKRVKRIQNRTSHCTHHECETTIILLHCDWIMSDHFNIELNYNKNKCQRSKEIKRERERLRRDTHTYRKKGRAHVNDSACCIFYNDIEMIHWIFCPMDKTECKHTTFWKTTAVCGMTIKSRIGILIHFFFVYVLNWKGSGRLIEKHVILDFITKIAAFEWKTKYKNSFE